jgi:hypothetical protein
MTPRPIPDSATVVATPDLLASHFEREIVLLSLRDGMYYGLDDVGARLWSLLRHPMTVRGLREAIVTEYQVEPERCERDIRALLAEMLARGLIEVRE